MAIEQALLEGLDYAELLVDLLALDGYGAANIAQVVGTTAPYCRIEQEFQLAMFGASILNTPSLYTRLNLGRMLASPVALHCAI